MNENLTERYAGKTILVTGGQGFVGSAFVRALLPVKCKLIVLDRAVDATWIGVEHSAAVEFWEGDITLRATWESVLPGVDYLFHFAALEYDRRNYDLDADFRVNTLSLYHCLEVCRERGLRPLIAFSSSANLFGRVAACPVNEQMRDDPPSLWSAHKLTAENYLRIYSSRYGIRSVVLRLANVYGPAGRMSVADRVVLNYMVKRALGGHDLVLYSNSKVLRDFVFSSDVVTAFLSTVLIPDSGQDGRFFVIGGGERRTIADAWHLVAESAGRKTGKTVQVRVDDKVALEPLDYRDFIADTSLFSFITGWIPETGLAKGLDMTTDAFMSVGR